MDKISTIEYTKNLMDQTSKKLKRQKAALEETEQAVAIATANRWNASLPALQTKLERQAELVRSTTAAIAEMEETLRKLAK